MESGRRHLRRRGRFGRLDRLRREDHPAKGVTTFDVFMSGRGLRKREGSVDDHAVLAGVEPLQQVLDHRPHARVLGQKQSTEEYAVQRIVVGPEGLRLDLRATASRNTYAD